MIEQGMSNNRSFLKETNQYSLLRYSAVQNNLRSGATSLFNVQRSMFDVGRSSLSGLGTSI
jgi:hypothetical protein